MTKISVRPIRRDEIGEFAATGTDPKRIDDVTQYVEQMMKQGSIHREWCFVAVQGNRWVGRIAYWTLPKSGKPHAPVLLDLPWEQEQYLSIGAQLLQETLPLMRELGADQIGVCGGYSPHVSPMAAISTRADEVAGSYWFQSGTGDGSV